MEWRGRGRNNVTVIRREKAKHVLRRSRGGGVAADTFAEIPIFVTAHRNIHYTTRTGIILI